jgi:hypothetical protein
MPVSELIAGSRMLTAEVLALTMNVDRQVTARTPPAAAAVAPAARADEGEPAASEGDDVM